MDATLKELTGLIKEVNPESRRRGTYFDFAIVYPDLRQGPRCSSRDIGTTVAGQKVRVQCRTWRISLGLLISIMGFPVPRVLMTI